MSITKKNGPTNNDFQVTFTLPNELVNGTKKIHLVGEFNAWDASSHPLKKTKDGRYQVTVKLKKDKSYQFRYLLDENHWENDWEADEQVPTPFENTYNSVVKL